MLDAEGWLFSFSATSSGKAGLIGANKMRRDNVVAEAASMILTPEGKNTPFGSQTGEKL